jgi:acetyltransferase-like isoleucine patch superfamily enzyme
MTQRWFTVWLKRALTLGSLARLIVRRAWLVFRGASVGELTVMEPCKLEGRFGNLSVGRESFVGCGTHFALHARIDIGARVVINRDVTILTASHSLRDADWRMYRRSVKIEDYAWIATGAMILPGVTIGRGAVVAARAVVRSDVPPFSLAVGNPAIVSETQRNRSLNYSPARNPAPYEAWLGSI